MTRKAYNVLLNDIEAIVAESSEKVSPMCDVFRELDAGNPSRMGLGWSLLQSQPGHDWMERRKIFKKVLGPQAISDYDQLIEREAESFVDKLKGRLTFVLQRSIGAVIIELAYGAKVFEEHGAELVKLNVESLDYLTWSFQQ
ncbi:5594_t:CDS:2, partial [Acaulospora colombiana]